MPPKPKGASASQRSHLRLRVRSRPNLSPSWRPAVEETELFGFALVFRYDAMALLARGFLFRLDAKVILLPRLEVWTFFRIPIATKLLPMLFVQFL